MAEAAPEGEETKGEEDTVPPSTTTEAEHLERLEELEDEEDESVLTVYDPEEFGSTAIISDKSTIPVDLFEFEHSYSYDCQKHFNLCACDESVVAWSAGSVITFRDVSTDQTWFRRSTTGGSVGHITSYRKEPNYRIAVAESREGDRGPLILLYTWPQMEIDAVLREGTTNAYSTLDFSPDGELLASVGKEPDYNITIWVWKRHKILLRTSAFTFDVNTVVFSPYVPGQLTTGGAAHIKFWKMALTFTGLKLKGELGRFGKTEICDIVGVYPMPDEKVLSGCEWGNILVWEAGLVKVEVTQKARKRCHGAPVIQFMLSEAGDEVTTVARDGCVRAWYWDTVEQADPPEDDQYVELNPVAETCVPGAAIMCIRHQKELFWYAQDGNGGLWTVELELDKVKCDHRKVFTCHAGAVVALCALRSQPLLVSLGADGAIHIYHTEDRTQLLRYCFPTPISCLFYPPVEVDPTSLTLIVGFGDGVLRTMYVDAQNLLAKSPGLTELLVESTLTMESVEKDQSHYITLLSLLKPHSAAVTQISMNPQHTLLVTIGEDTTLFMYRVDLAAKPFELQRLGFIETPNNIAYIAWKPDEERTLLLCGQVGLMLEAMLPLAEVRPYEEITTFRLDFHSYKETLLRKYFIRYKPFPEEDDLASLDEEALKKQDEGDNDEEEEEWLGEVEIVISESMLGGTVTWAEYNLDGTVWCVQKGLGALILTRPGNKDIIKYGPLPGAWCDNITTVQFICDKRYVVAGTGNGYVRVVRMLTAEEDCDEVYTVRNMLALQKLLKRLKGRRLNKQEPDPVPRLDFADNYYLPMHDSYTGAISGIVITADNKRMFSSGADGNIFSYLVNFPEPLVSPVELPEDVELPTELKGIKETSTLEEELMSHERLKQKEEYDKMMAIANAHKKRVRDQLASLTNDYLKLIKANRMLPSSQQIDVTLDSRPLEEQEREVEEARALVRRKLAHQLEASDIGLAKMYNRNIICLDVFPFKLKGIKDPKVVIQPMRQKNLSSDFFDQLDEVHRKMAEAALRGKRSGSVVRHATVKKMVWGGPRTASFLLGLPPKPPHPLQKALRNYYQRLNRHHNQHIEWQEHLSLKPDPNAMPPGAAEALQEAEATIGNHLLKTQPDYVAPPGHNTQLRLCLTRQEIYESKHAFNLKVVALRAEKVQLVERMREIGHKVQEIRCEVPAVFAIRPPEVPPIDEDLEFPEKNLEVRIKVPPISGKLSKSKAERRKSTFYQPRNRQPRVPPFVELMENRPMVATWELLKGKDFELSPIEMEIKARRIHRRLYEQDMLVVDAEMAVGEFDVQLQQLQRERIRVQERNQVLELHLHQLHREMIVLNRFESHEDSLAARVYDKLLQVRAVQEQMEWCEHRIEEHMAERERLEGACQEMQRSFKRLVADNKFADFLRRIFKKKYRPPRTRDPDESSESESSSSSSEEEDEGSVDSRDIGPIRLDPTVCPEGCEREIYDQTYELRDTRHKYEQEMREQERLVELLRRDIEAHQRVRRTLTTQLEKRQNNLREFMTEKQSCLNEVEVTVILRYDQLRANALEECDGPAGLSDTLVFPETLLARLRRRVLELQQEIRDQKQRHKTNRTHLHRMEVDIRFMEGRVEELRARMRTILVHKLGKVRRVDRTLDDLLKQMTRRFKFQAASATHREMYKQIRHWRERYGELEQKYLKTLDVYSERLRLAAALQADQYPIKEQKDLRHMYGSYRPDEYERDVVRLNVVRRQQRDHILALRDEISRLKVKPLSPLPPFLPSEAPPGDAGEHYQTFEVPPRTRRIRTNYFPLVSPETSTNGLGLELGPPGAVGDSTVVTLLWECAAALGFRREDCMKIISDLTALLPSVIAGTRTRYEVVDSLLRSWLHTPGHDPHAYKMNTLGFEALNRLADALIQQHLAYQAGGTPGGDATQQAGRAALDAALELSAGRVRPGASLQSLVKGKLETLLHAVPIKDIESAEGVTAIVTSVLNELAEVPKEEELDKIDIDALVEELEGGSAAPGDSLSNIVESVMSALFAQIPTTDESQQIQAEVETELAKPLSTSELRPPSTTESRRLPTSDSRRLSTTESIRLSTTESRRLSPSDCKRLSASGAKTPSALDGKRLSASDAKTLSASDGKRLSASDAKSPSALDGRQPNDKSAQVSLLSSNADYTNSDDNPNSGDD